MSSSVTLFLSHTEALEERAVYLLTLGFQAVWPINTSIISSPSSYSYPSPQPNPNIFPNSTPIAIKSIPKAIAQELKLAHRDSDSEQPGAASSVQSSMAVQYSMSPSRGVRRVMGEESKERVGEENVPMSMYVDPGACDKLKLYAQWLLSCFR